MKICFLIFGPISGKDGPAKIFVVVTRMDGHGINDADLEQPESEVVEAHYVWQYFTVTNNTEAKKGGSKNAQCMFCDKSFSGCSTSKAAAHILARPVMNQDRAGIQPCVAIKKRDDDRLFIRPAVQYLFREWLIGEIAYEFDKRYSSYDVFDYQSNTILLSLKFAL